MPRLLLGLLGLLLAAPAEAQLAVRGDTVYTMAGPPLVDGVVLVGADGRIERVGAAAQVGVPDGYRVLEAVVVTPGLVDARSTVGLSGLLNQEQDQDALDEGAPLQPALRALDAYNAADDLVAWLLGFGVTTVHTGHAPGALAAGQTAIVKTAYPTLDEALVDSTAMMAMTLGPSLRRRFESPGTRARAVADLRRALYEALDHDRKREADDPDDRPARDLDKEALAAVAQGRMPALLEVHRANDILTALRVAEEFPRMRLVLSGASEVYHVLDAVRAARVPVVLHPTMMRAGGETENATLETARRLHEAGVPFAFQSGYESYVPKTRVVLFEAAVAAAYGLPREAALAAVTRDAARILSIDARVGSLEPGKDGDLALFDGDPLEHTTHVCAVVVDGRVVREDCQ
ncbi:MAG: amidohydrolase family protein [Rubricoccaceae bacterium]|nr:amidohydrolase family protein [Rubricoccaceae bacterium]